MFKSLRVLSRLLGPTPDPEVICDPDLDMIDLVVPVLNLGGHETLYVVWRGEALARISGAKRILRSDSFPLFFALPWGVALGPIFHLPIPAKLDVEVGEPIDLWDYLEGDDPEDRATLERLSGLVQDRLQQMMDRRAARRRWPILG